MLTNNPAYDSFYALICIVQYMVEYCIRRYKLGLIKTSCTH
jgi:hypothetical protein